MKKSLILILAGLVSLVLAAGCKNETPKSAEQAAPQQAPSAGKTGTVLETMNAAGYTYVQVDTGAEKVWAAAPEFQVKVGDPVVVPEGMPMPNYHSKSLDRTFEMVYFVDAILVGGAQEQAAAQMPAGHPQVAADAATAGVDFKGLKKAEGGKTVEEILGNTKTLSGKEVKVRGKVVKFNAEIMGKNWIHLQDGTGAAGSNDLTITTSSMAKVGDTVLVTGKLTLDKDFGYGYKYAAILEDAKVVVE